MPNPASSRANGFKPGNDYSQGRPPGARNIRSTENRLKWEAKGYADPLDFFGSIMNDPEQPTETRLAAGNLATPYLHSKLGAIPIPPDPTFMEIKLKNPDPVSIAQCVENITLLTNAKASGEVSIEHADSLIADQKVILYAMLDQQKQITAEGGPRETTIRIEGGLPLLPGTTIDMPDLTNGNAAGEPLRNLNGHDPAHDQTESKPSTQEP
jgi:hypothetical protein